MTCLLNRNQAGLRLILLGCANPTAGHAKSRKAYTPVKFLLSDVNTSYVSGYYPLATKHCRLLPDQFWPPYKVLFAGLQLVYLMEAPFLGFPFLVYGYQRNPSPLFY